MGVLGLKEGCPYIVNCRIFIRLLTIIKYSFIVVVAVVVCRCMILSFIVVIAVVD